MATNQNISNSASDDAGSFSLQKVSALLKSTEEFPVDFDDAWQWIGYSRKSDAKESLEASFDKGSDFCGIIRKNTGRGRPTEKIYLTLECFKSFCMMAGTAKGKEVRRYFLECEKELNRLKEENKPRQRLGAYAKRVEEIEHSCKNIPLGHWCVLEEAASLLIYVEGTLKLPVDKADLLDGSVGKHWANYRKDKPWAGDRAEFRYTFPDGRVVNPWAYQDNELFEFRRWLKATYRSTFLPDYLSRKYGVIVKV